MPHGFLQLLQAIGVVQVGQKPFLTFQGQPFNVSGRETRTGQSEATVKAPGVKIAADDGAIIPTAYTLNGKLVRLS